MVTPYCLRLTNNLGICPKGPRPSSVSCPQLELSRRQQICKLGSIAHHFELEHCVGGKPGTFLCSPQFHFPQAFHRDTVPILIPTPIVLGQLFQPFAGSIMLFDPSVIIVGPAANPFATYVMILFAARNVLSVPTSIEYIWPCFLVRRLIAAASLHGRAPYFKAFYSWSRHRSTHITAYLYLSGLFFCASVENFSAG
jgi:hypothetical protein